MNLLMKIYSFLPPQLQRIVGILFSKTNIIFFVLYFLKRKIIKYLKNDPETDCEKQNIIAFLERNKFNVFPYDFVNKIRTLKVEVFYDCDCGMNYVNHVGKKMYFPKGWRARLVKSYYAGLLIEQDNDSPHRYETIDFHVHENDIIVDAGAAEGIFTLTNIEKIKKAYLFECDERWLAALNKTFEPWKDKVIIVNKYISNITDDKQVSIDDFFCDEEVDIIKADIEGAEKLLLEGSKKIMAKTMRTKFILCTYHNQTDYEEIRQTLIRNDYNTYTSNGYMIFAEFSARTERCGCSAPYLRKGVIRAVKNRKY